MYRKVHDRFLGEKGGVILPTYPTATFEILNINPIFLPVRSPDLNPIEDLWRIIKDRIYKTYYNTLNELIEIFEGGFRGFVGRESLYENWLEVMV